MSRGAQFASPSNVLEHSSTVMQLSRSKRALAKGKKIWIDLDNSPHVPFFLPIIEALRKRGCTVVLTARDSYQVCELLKLHQISCKIIGRHWGKHRIFKMIGTLIRSLLLVPPIRSERPALAVSHGSRGQLFCSIFLRIPNLLIYDYEHTAGTGFLHPDWVLAPEAISNSRHHSVKNPALKYPGLKEDVYVLQFKPDPSIRPLLTLSENDIIVTLRPPAIEAHYHNPESEFLFDAVMERLTHHPDTKIVLLPRNAKQDVALRKRWGDWIRDRKIVIPEGAIDGLNLIWFSDLVISGGGTMNREAAALSVPVYSIFRGRIGAVDRYLAQQGRLTLIETVADVHQKIMLIHRIRPERPDLGQRLALQAIVDHIVMIVEAETAERNSRTAAGNSAVS